MSSVDVIVPCYRYGHFLRQCVESVLTQSGVNVRVLIIDDASPDNTAEVATELAEKNSRVTFLRHAQNKGHIDTYNEGIEWASADYMLLLSADDYLLPGALKRSAGIMDAHPEVGLTFGEVIEQEDDELTKSPANSAASSIGDGWSIVSGLEFIDISGASNIVRTPSAVVRTQLQKRLGGYRRELPHSGDMEMWFRFAASGSVGILKTYQAVYRRHRTNMSLKYVSLLDLQQRKAAFDSFFGTCSDKLADAQRVRRKFYWSLGCEALACASAAFNQGELAHSEQLSEYAFSLSRRARFSLPWIKLTCKRGLGFKVYSALRPSVVESARERSA